jgi:glycosyltransferase involved in cell wall biosynthesis
VAIIKTKPKIVFLITEDWYFWSHRLHLARTARDAGFEVIVATRVHKHKELIENEGFKLIPICMVRRSRNIIVELLCIVEIVKMYRIERPDIVFHVAIKPILYGSWAAKITRIPYTVNAYAGLGFMYIAKGWRASIFRFVVSVICRLTFLSKNLFVIFQNPDDMNLFINAGIIKREKSLLIQGAGVDTSLYSYKPEPDEIPIIVLASRIVWDKGIKDLIDAARILGNDGVRCRVILVGSPDTENPVSISDEILLDWHNKGIVEWWGYRENIHEIFANSNIIVLPSYREGLPKVLLEAASCGRAIVATDVPGCREIVRHNENGILVPPKDPKSLAEALKKLVMDTSLRKKMGKRGRDIVVKEFSEEIVTQKTIDFYFRLLNKQCN